MEKEIYYIERLKELCSKKEIVEIIAHDREITGKITEVGKDFIGVTFSIEKEIIKQPQEKKEEAQKQIVVMEIETFFRLDIDVKSISRIKRKIVR